MTRCLYPWEVKSTSLVALALLAAGCGSSELSKRCERAISKVMLEELYEAPGAKGKPGEDEKAVMATVKAAAQVRCEAEGLTEAQAACFEAIVDIETLFRAADCPAIKDDKPSWFIVPPPEARRQALENMKPESLPAGPP